MKKTLLVIMAALSMLLTQCKKSEAESPSDGKPVNITLNVGGNSKINVNPGDGTVAFTSGDNIYVASGGVYVGTLTAQDNKTFSGTIFGPKEGEPLQFYFLGNKTPNEELTAETTDELTINISDQSSELPVISYAPSKEIYPSNDASYSAFLLNKCALVKFDVSNYTGNGTVGIKGMNNQVTVALNGDQFSYGKIGDGEITLNKNNNEYWAILLPQNAVEGGEAYSSDGWTGNYSSMPEIAINDYLQNGIAVNLTAPAFTINADGDKVEFSPGNLYYDGSSWHFEAHQWDYRTYQGLDAFIDGETPVTKTPDGHWGSFGWSTNHTDAFWGMDISTTDNNYSNTFVDWGTNIIGTDAAGTWHTLSQEEWYYLLKTRTNASILCTVKFLDDELHEGLVILPDGTNSSVMDKITKTADLAIYGAVFLPIAGQRKGTTLLEKTTGYYWTNTFYKTSGTSIGANCLSFYKTTSYITISIASYSWAKRYMGHSVRLVRDCSK